MNICENIRTPEAQRAAIPQYIPAIQPKPSEAPVAVHSEHDEIEVDVADIRQESVDVLSFELRAKDLQDLPPFTAGAHIDIRIPELPSRSYSLCNAPNERHRYVIAVRKETPGRGGSRYLHEQVAIGSRLTISPPKNHFPLVENAPHIVFIAGGIGITPILSMIRKLAGSQSPFELHYCVRTPDHASFHELLTAQRSETSQIHFHFDEGRADKMLDLRALLDRTRPDTHLYCCGPKGVMDAFRSAATRWPDAQIHTEYFSGDAIATGGAGFEVELARSGRTISVLPEQSILDALAAAGIDAPYSCREGVCGNCETRIIDGKVEHRDLVLSASERESGKTMMICCSRSLEPKLVLDL